MGEFGARVISPGQVRFRFWAPDCETVSLRLAGHPTLPMARDADGVFEVITDCEVGTCYKYQVAPDHEVPDPASSAQAGDVHNDSIVVDHDFAWERKDWRGRPWHESVIYELHVGSFGGFAGVRSHLQRLAALGVTAVQLMPIGDFPGTRNWGYDGVLPYAPDAAYGTPDDLKSLIDMAHGYGLQVFLDVVYNHFGPDGNYLNAYAAEFFNQDVHTPWGGAINVNNQHVRRFFIENAIYWLVTFRFDGLRFDAVHAIKNDAFLLEMAAEIRRQTPGRHVHLILENENNSAELLNDARATEKFDAQWTDDWHHCLHVLLTSEREGYYEDFQDPAVQLARCLAEGFAYQGEASKHAGGVPRGSPSVSLPPNAFVICLQNHDQIGNRAFGERLSTLANPQALRAAVLLLLLTPQIPMIFMGEEWAEEKPFLFFTDHHDELADAVREGRRKEFVHFQAFTDPAMRARIPDPNARETFEMSVPEFSVSRSTAQDAMVALYQSCLDVRKTLMPHLAGAKSLGAAALGRAGVYARWRLSNGDVLAVAANFGVNDLQLDDPVEDFLLASAAGPFETSTLPAYTSLAWIAS